jgi:hypothetical protein
MDSLHVLSLYYFDWHLYRTYTGSLLGELMNNCTCEAAANRTNSSNMIGYQLNKFILENTHSGDQVNVAFELQYYH